jgi:glutamyl-tRNA reductase
VEPFLHELLSEPGVAEAVALSTCNRTELYLVVDDPVDAESAVLALLARRAGTRPTELMDAIYVQRNCDAARHLFRVVSGLESMIVGEAEIQGQVKRAYERALHARTTGPLVNKLFRAALATGKRVRTETTISTGRSSVASVAVDAARAVVGSLESRHVVIVGAGETAELTARAFHDQGVSTMFVANRRRDRAIALAERFGGASGSFDSLPVELERADVVVSSTASPHAIIEAEELAEVMAQRSGRPLQAEVRAHLRVRQAEAARAVDIVEDEIQTFAGWLGALEVMPTLGALRARGDAIVDLLLEENSGRWETLSPRDAERLEAFGRAIVKRVLHEPTQRVKELDPEHRHARLSLLRELFGLDDAPAAESADDAEVRRLGA